MATLGIPGLPDSDSSDSDSSSCSSDDSSSQKYSTSFAKRRKRVKANHVIGSMPAPMEQTGSHKSQRRRVNNIWGAVIQESVLDGVVHQVAINRNDRDVESYNYRTNLPVPSTEDSLDGCDRHSTDNNLDPSDIAISADVDPEPSDDPFGSSNFPAVDIGRLESGKFHPESRPFFRNDRGRRGRKRKRHSRPPGRRQNYRRPPELKVTEESSVEEVTTELVNLMRERNWDLVNRVVQNLGVKRALEFYYATSHVESKGGMMTYNGERRRSPGGVFFALIKEDEQVTQIEKEDIFRKSELEREKLKVMKKSKKLMLRNAPGLPDSDEEVDSSEVKAALQLVVERRQELMQQSHDDSAGSGGSGGCSRMKLPVTPHNTPDSAHRLGAETAMDSEMTEGERDTEMCEPGELEEGEIL